MSDHEYDGADCCKDHQSAKLANDYLSGLISLDEYWSRVHALENSQDSLRTRLAFLETRRAELQEMCARRSRELIEANKRIAHLERCLGRLVAEKESHGS